MDRPPAVTSEGLWVGPLQQSEAKRSLHAGPSVTSRWGFFMAFGEDPPIMLLVSGKVSFSCHPPLLAMVFHGLLEELRHSPAYTSRAWLGEGFLAPAAKGILSKACGTFSLWGRWEWPHLLGRSCWRRELVLSGQSCTKVFLFPVSPSKSSLCLSTHPANFTLLS